jgi:hypothetical protein
VETGDRGAPRVVVVPAAQHAHGPMNQTTHAPSDERLESALELELHEWARRPGEAGERAGKQASIPSHSQTGARPGGGGKVYSRAVQDAKY